MKLPYQNVNIASEDFQILEDLATGSWFSEVLFAALELGVFDALSRRPSSVENLAVRLHCDCDSLGRFTAALATLGLLVETAGKYENGPLAARYLVQNTPGSAGNFIAYRRFLAPSWKRLATRIRAGVRANDRSEEDPQEAYHERVFSYVRAMDFQAQIKAAEAADQLVFITDIEPRWMLDLGGGAGAWCRALIGKWPQAHAVLVDLPEILSAARKLYPGDSNWEGIEAVAANALNLCFADQKFDLIILSNILHAYGTSEANEILTAAVRTLVPGGLILVHDYLADGHRSSPLKGRLYDLHMMLNTYNGRVYELRELQAMLDSAGIRNSRILHLPTDTSVILAAKDGSTGHRFLTNMDMVEARARAFGFDFARVMNARDIVVEPWVRIKCEQGCSRYAASLTCPPHSPDEKKMRDILSGYTDALLVQATPPSRDFHDRLLALERFLFLKGHPEALAFGAGPCPVCPACPSDGLCRFPKMARPSLEACGVDVYETARRAGLTLRPVPHPAAYVQFVGIVLFKQESHHAHSVGPGAFNPGL